MSFGPYIAEVTAVQGESGVHLLYGVKQDASGINQVRVFPSPAFRIVAITVGYWLRIVLAIEARKVGPVPIEPTTLNEVINAGISLGLWDNSVTTLNDVINTGLFIGLSIVGGTLNQVIARGRALGYWL